MQHLLDGAGWLGQRGGGVLQLRREVVWGQGHVETDAEDGPPFLGAAFNENPRHLPVFDQDVVGPLDLSGVVQLVTDFGYRDARGEGEEPGGVPDQQ